ncbi:hypothetical protein J2Y02_003388 [Neobacillus drentensis]|nr:hypothetical protein [Neobacillus drentensis]
MKTTIDFALQEPSLKEDLLHFKEEILDAQKVK